MLNQRQIEILLELCNHTEEYLTASYFADKLNVSLRTVQRRYESDQDRTGRRILRTY